MRQLGRRGQSARLPRQPLSLVALHRGQVEGKQPPALGEALELAHPELNEPQPTSSQQLADRGTHQYLPGGGLGHHPCCQVHSDPADFLFVKFHLTGVQPGADLDLQRRHPRHRRGRGPHRRRRSVETGQEPVPGGVHLAAAMSRQHTPDHAVVTGQQCRPSRISKILQTVG